MGDKWRLPELEVKILNCLWNLKGEGTIQEILESWEGELPLYTTILKKLQIMEKKEVVTHRKEGKAYRYITLISREEVSTRRLGEMIRHLFGGDKLKLVNTFIKYTELKEEDIRAIREMLAAKEQEGK